MLAATEKRLAVALAALVLVCGCTSRPGAGKVAHEPSADQDADGPVAKATAKALSGPAVVTLDKNYDRTKSRVLVRQILLPTKANIEFAFYDSNIATYDPSDYRPAAPEKKPALADLDFGGALVGDSLVDTIGKTPLTETERNAPLSWVAMSNHLNTLYFDEAEALVACGARVSEEKWGDEEIPVAFQEIARAYLHEGEGAPQMWVSVEFKPWVTFLDGVDDEDGDGFPEIYGRLPDGSLNEALVKELTGDYCSVVLDREEVLGADGTGEGGAIYGLCSDLYPRYNTEMLDPAQLAAFPDEDAKKLVGNALDCLGGRRPDLVVAARPFEEWHVYDVFVIEGFAE